MRQMFLITLVILAAEALLSAAPRRILSIGMSGSPQLIDNKNVRYSADIVFDSIPEHSWFRYDYRRGGIVIELIGDSISETSKPLFKKDDPFSSVKVSNYSDSMSLSRMHAIIFLKAGDDWHYESETVSGSTMRIYAEKIFSQHRKRHFPLVPFLFVSILAVASAAAAVALHETNE